jgi:UPF0042 nucleotide-binding protein
MNPSIYVVTGLSGAGKSSALKTLEDFGCEVIDNLPISLCTQLVQEKKVSTPLALGIDVRTRDFNIPLFLTCLAQLRQQAPNQVKILFFEAHAHAIETRYRESRRQHPLGVQATLSVLIEKEQSLLAPVREHADYIVDTTALSPPEMKKFLQNTLDLKRDAGPTIYVLSFAYRRGVPYNADLVFDMRFLPNPYYQKQMKFLTGKSPEVLDYLSKEPLFQKFMEAFGIITLDLLLKDSRPAFVIAFGCSGGRHRSVFTAESALTLVESKGFSCSAYHRDLV